MEKNTTSFAFCCIILLGVMLFIPSISAQNTASAYPIVEVKSWCPLGICIPILSEKLQTIELLENTGSCSDNCEAVLNITMHKDGVPIKSIKFETITGKGNNIIQDIYSSDITIKVGESVKDVDDYEKICNEIVYENGTKTTECIDKVIGKHKEYSPIYDKYVLGNELPVGEYQIKIEGSKREDKVVDWIITTGHEDYEVREMAIWGEMTSDLVAGWNMNEGTGTLVKDETGIYNGTLSNAEWINGKVSYGINFTSANSIDSMGDVLDMGDNSITLSAWIKPEVTMGDEYIIVKRALVAGSEDGYAIQFDDNTHINCHFYDNKKMVIPAIATGNWTHIACMYDVTNGNVSAWINGLFITNVTTTIDTQSNAENLRIGNRASLAEPFGGIIDDVNIFNRTLTSTEMYNLYRYPEGYAMTVLNAPANNYVYESNNVQFNCSSFPTAPATLVNITLWTNKTGTWAISNTTTTSGKIMSLFLNEGSYAWSCQSCDSDSICKFATENRTIKTQTYMQFCNGTYNNPFINFTFKDEFSSAIINGTLTPLSGDYYDTSGGSVQSLSFTNTTENPSYAFCGYPVLKNLRFDGSVKYSAAGYPSRTIYLNQTLTNTTTNRQLLLLASEDGIYVTFQVVNSGNVVVTNAKVNVTNAEGNVGILYTDSAGSATFWLDPIKSHSIIVSHPSYTTTTQTITPSQSTYTITLGTTSTTVNSSSQGINVIIQPFSEYLAPNTVYHINVTYSTSTNSFVSYAFNLTNQDKKQLNYTSGNNPVGGILDVTINTGNNTHIVLVGYYETSLGNITFVRGGWNVWNNTDLNWSISYLITDVKTYTSSGLFGLKTGFSMNLIIFFIIFLSVGVISYKYGVTSPVAIAWMITGIVFIFDIAFGLIANPVTAVKNFAFIFTLIIAIAITIKEVAGY